MEALIWIGAALSLAGIGGLIACIVYVMQGRRTALDETAMRARLKRAVALNLAALLTSAFGLMMVVVGVILT